MATRCLARLVLACALPGAAIAEVLIKAGAWARPNLQAKNGYTALMGASVMGHTDVVELLLDKGASVEEKDNDGKTALMRASIRGHTEMVELLLDRDAPVDEKDKDGKTALIKATAGVKMVWQEGYIEVAKQLLDKGALLDAMEAHSHTALLALAGVEGALLGRMAAAQVHRKYLQTSKVAPATAKAVLQLLRLAGSARASVIKMRSSNPSSADDVQVLFARLQLAAAACVQYDEHGKARDDAFVQELFDSKDGNGALELAVQIGAKELLAQPVVQKYVRIAWSGRDLHKWCYYHRLEDWLSLVWRALLLLQLLFLLLPVLLVPHLETWLIQKLGENKDDKVRSGGFLPPGDNKDLYLLRLPIVKFGLECAADLALALALTLIPAADLATAPVAPLLLVWVGSGFLREFRQLVAASNHASTRKLTWSKDTSYETYTGMLRRSRYQNPEFVLDSGRGMRRRSRAHRGHVVADCFHGCVYTFGWAASVVPLLLRVYGRLAAHWGDSINLLDTTALIFSLAALLATVSTTDDSALVPLLSNQTNQTTQSSMYRADDTATSLRAAAVLLLWLRLIRVLLVSPRFGPFVLMFFTMLLGDVLSFLVLLVFMLVAFTFSWNVLLETGGSPRCADELGGVDIFLTLVRLLEGALTSDDFFECANDSDNRMAAWILSLVFVTLTAVLLLNMLIAMCAVATQS